MYKRQIISGANNLTNNKKRVDELNVFPVPDGDTGTNMSMTINGAVRAVSYTHLDVYKRQASACFVNTPVDSTT